MPDLQTSTIPLEQIRESPHNHRKHFDEAQLEELAASVKAHGVLQPVLVRPVARLPKAPGRMVVQPHKYELVYGHRRFRAARLAGLKALPANVRELDDKAALEVALIENCRRADVLPMEEAEGYRELHEVHKVSVEQLAEQVGKSKEYVYGRLKLCELKSPAVRKALDAGKVSPSTALLVARIPGEKLQEAAAKKILEGGAWDEEAAKPGPMSYRRAQRLIEDEYMLDLKKASFDTKDAKLVLEAGLCGTCPKRTGNCKELYPEVKSGNVCTDPECFSAKKAATFKLEQQAAKEKGQKLIKASDKLWDWEGKELSYTGQQKYVELTDTVPGDRKARSFKELLGDKAPVVLARDKHGKVHQLLEKEGLNELLAAAGHKVKVEERAPARDYVKEREEEEFLRRVVGRALDAAAQKVLTGKLKVADVLALMAEHLAAWYGEDMRDEAVERWLSKKPEKPFPAGTSAETLIAFMIEAFYWRELRNTWNGYTSETKEVVEAFGLDLEALEHEQRKADATTPPVKGGEYPLDSHAQEEDGEVDSEREYADDGEEVAPAEQPKRAGKKRPASPAKCMAKHPTKIAVMCTTLLRGHAGNHVDGQHSWGEAGDVE